MLTEGMILACDVIGIERDKHNMTMYQVKLADGSSDEVFLVEPLRFYADTMPPEKVYCRVEYSFKGSVRLVQDEYATLNRIYSPSRVYRFKVLKQLTDSQSGKRRYLISAVPHYKHIFTAHRDEVLTVGEVFSALVTIKACSDMTACLFYKWVLDDSGEFSPKALFERCGHGGDYAKLFEGLIRDKEVFRDKGHLVDDMQQKLSNANRLWVFDYLTLLSLWVFSREGHSLGLVKRGCQLLRDIDIYLLEESGLMMAFTVERRLETQKKAESNIQRAEWMLEACSIVEGGRQGAFLSAMLRKLGNVGYLRDRERQFGILNYIGKLDKDFVEQHLMEFSRLLYCLKRLKLTTETVRMLMKKLVYIMNGRRKKLSLFQIHHVQESPDRTELVELVQLIGSVMGVYTQFGIDKTSTELNDRRLFTELCSLVAYLTSCERGLRVVDKAISFLIHKETPVPFDRMELFTAGEDPEALVDVILNMQIEESEKPLLANTSLVLMRYYKETLSLAKLPAMAGTNWLRQLNHIVYRVPGTCLATMATQMDTPWPESAPLLFYRDRWKAFNDMNHLPLAASTKTEGVLVRTKQPNPDFKGLIFCRSVDDGFFEDGAIGYQQYAANFIISDMTEFFSPNLLLVADVERRSDGHIIFNVTRNLMRFSQVNANVGEKVLAHCLHFNRDTAMPFFITKEGVMCRGVADSERYYQVSGGYEVEIIDQGTDDFPTCRMIKPASTNQRVTSCLRKQLIKLSAYNERLLEEKGEPDVPEWQDYPYIHQYLYPYLYWANNEVTLYNTLHILRLIALKERSQLYNMYSAVIQKMELRACQEAGVPYVTSLQEFQLNEEILKQFPSLVPFAAELRSLNIGVDRTGVAPHAEDMPIMLRFFDGGSFMLGDGVMPRLPLVQLRLPQSGYIVLCYANGNLAKYPASKAKEIQQGVMLPAGSHGVPLLRVFALEDKDAVLLRIHRVGVSYVKLVPVEKIREVSSLVELGAPVMALSSTEVPYVFGVKHPYEPAACLVDSDPQHPGFFDTLPENVAALNWVFDQIKSNEPQTIIPNETLLKWLRTGLFDRILFYIDETRQATDLRSQQGEQMQWLLDQCANGDEFWSLAEVLLQRNLHFYCSMVERKLPQLELSFLQTTGDGIARAIRCLLRYDGSLSNVMRIFYPLRSLFGEQEKALIHEAKRDFKSPVLYLQLIEMAGMSIDEVKKLLLKEDTGAARFALFELVRRQYEVGAISRDEVLAYIARWDETSVRNSFTQDLFWVGVLNERARQFPSAGVDRILRGGYQVFCAAIRLNWEKAMTFCKGNMQTYVGRTFHLSIERVSNHYYIGWLSKLPVLIPKQWCAHSYGVSQKITVQVERGLDRMRMLFASEQGMHHPLPKPLQLLRAGDPVDVMYEQLPDRLHPILHKEFNRLAVVVQDEPTTIKPNRVYKAVVVGQRDELTFYVKLND